MNDTFIYVVRDGNRLDCVTLDRAEAFRLMRYFHDHDCPNAWVELWCDGEPIDKIEE